MMSFTPYSRVFTREGPPSLPLRGRLKGGEVLETYIPLTGVDLTQIDAIDPYSALRLLSEIGTDMRRWPTEKHFTSWLTLAPHNKISGGRVLSSQTQPSANRAAAILRMAASGQAVSSAAITGHLARTGCAPVRSTPPFWKILNRRQVPVDLRYRVRRHVRGPR